MDFLLVPLVGVLVSGVIVILVLVLIAISKSEDKNDGSKMLELDKPTVLLQTSTWQRLPLLSSDFENPSNVSVKEYAEVLNRKMQDQGMIGAYEKDGVVVVNPHPKPLHFEVVLETCSEIAKPMRRKNEKE